MILENWIKIEIQVDSNWTKNTSTVKYGTLLEA